MLWLAFPGPVERSFNGETDNIPSHQAGKNMARERWVFFLAALLLNSSLRCHSEGGSRWRVYGAADGLGESSVVGVTVSPRGNVWAKKSSGPVSWLDGFQARSIPLSESGNFPVYESRS